MAAPKLNKFQQSVLDNRLRLINNEPALDAMIAKRMGVLYKQIEAELNAIIGSGSKLTRTQAGDVARKLRLMEGKFSKLTKAQVASIHQEVAKIVKSTHQSEFYKHVQLIDGHLENFDSQFGVSFNRINRKAVQAAFTQTFPPGVINQTFGTVPAAFVVQLRKDIAGAIADGWTVDKLAKKWQGMNGALGVAKSRTSTVARTMVMQASSNAQIAAYNSQPDLIKGVQWEATFDSRTCPACAGRHGHQYARNEAPAMPAHFNCRCTWLPVFLNEKLNNKLDTQTAYKAPDNISLVTKQESREFDRWLKKQSRSTHEDFFGSKLKMKAWQEGQLDLEQLVDISGGWIKDQTVLKMVDSKWVTKTIGSVKAQAQQVNPKLVQVPKGQLTAPIAPKPVAPPPITPQAPITLGPDGVQSTIGSIPIKISIAEPKPAPAPAPVPKPRKSVTVAEIKEENPTYVDPQVLDTATMKKVGGQMGSNEGGLYEDASGQKWYIKKPQTAEHADNEIITGKLYERFGVDVPELRRAIIDGEAGVASKWTDGVYKDASAFTSATPPHGTAVNFAIDAYLANWDVVGLNFDNIVIKAGKAYRIDTGGGLLFRAQGSPKGLKFGDLVDELDTLRNPVINPQSAAVFKSVTDQDIIDGIRKILAVPQAEIDSIVNEFGANLTMANRHNLAKQLRYRRFSLEAKLKELEQKQISNKPVTVPANQITRADFDGIKLDPPKPVSVTIVEPEFVKPTIQVPKFTVENPTPLGLPKTEISQLKKYDYLLSNTGSKGHKAMVAKAEKGDVNAMIRLAERAAYGYSNEFPSMDRALYWINRAAEFVNEAGVSSAISKLKNDIMGAQLTDAKFIPKIPLPTGAKKLIESAKSMGETIDPKTGLTKIVLPKYEKPPVQPIINASAVADDSAPVFTPYQIELALKSFKFPKSFGYGPVASTASGQVLPENTGVFARLAAKHLGWGDRKINSLGGIRKDSNTYFQRLDDGTGNIPRWVKFQRPAPFQPWEAIREVGDWDAGFASAKHINWTSILENKPGTWFRAPAPPKVDNVTITPAKNRKKAQQNFVVGRDFADLDSRAELKTNLMDASNETPLGLNTVEYRTKLNESIRSALPGEKGAVQDWSMTEYSKIRGHMAGDSDDAEYTFKKASQGSVHATTAMFNNLMRKLPRHTDDVVRGIKNIDEATITSDFKAGQSFYWTAHSSSSTLEQKAVLFAESSDREKFGVVFYLKGGNRKVYIKPLSQIPSEEESILLARTEYKVLNVEKVHGSNYYKIEIEETGLNDQELVDAARSSLGSISTEPDPTEAMKLIFKDEYTFLKGVFEETPE